MRIKYIIPFPLDAEGIGLRTAQIPAELFGPDVHVEIDAARNQGSTGLDSIYEMALSDIYVAEAGLRAEDEGYDAVVMDTVSDSGLQILRSRLSIPVVGPGQTAFQLATMLGQRFSVVTMLDMWKFFYAKLFRDYGLTERVASVRSLNVQPDFSRLFSGKEREMSERLTAIARQAIDEDGAEVIVLGSTTMHQAAEHMASHLPCPVINPGPAAVAMAALLVKLRLSHSKIAYPSPAVFQDDKFFSLMGADGKGRRS